MFSAWLVATGVLPAQDEAPENAVPPALARLQWMVGTWVHESEGVVMTLTVGWGESRQVLERQIEAKLGAAPVVRMSQTISWDPEAGVLKSSGLASDGTKTAGVWRLDGAVYSNKCEVTYADGRRGGAVNSWQLDEFNQCVFTSSQRRIGDKGMPDIAPTEFGALGRGGPVVALEP